MPAKTRQKIAQRLAQAEQLGQDEVRMLADTDDDDDDDDIVARNGAQGVGATGGGSKKDQQTVRAESEGDVDALTAKYLSLDAAAQARFRKMCGLSVAWRA
jgi:hypothetical protein